MPKILTTLLFLLCFCIQGVIPCAGREIVVVVNKNNPVAAMSSRKVELFFLGKKTRWPNGDPVQVAVNQEEDVYSRFCREILGKSPGQYLLYRKRLLFSGTGIPPQTVANDEEAKAFIAARENSISFIDRDSLEAGMRELTIY